MKRNLLTILCMAVSLILMALPYGVLLKFSDGTNAELKYYSYFDSLPFGYGNFFPLLTALLSIVTMFLMVFNIKQAKKAVRLFLVVSVIFSLLSIIFPSVLFINNGFNLFDNITPIAASFFILQISGLLIYTVKRRKVNEYLA